MNAELQKAGTSGRADAVSTNKLSKQGAAAPAGDLADEAVPTTIKARKSEKVSQQPSDLWHAGLPKGACVAMRPSFLVNCNDVNFDAHVLLMGALCVPGLAACSGFAHHHQSAQMPGPDESSDDCSLTLLVLRGAGSCLLAL